MENDALVRLEAFKDFKVKHPRLSRYHLDNQAECEEFVGALRSLLERVPLAVDVLGLLSHWRWFGEWSLGCIGVLSDWLVETVDTLCKEDATA